ncbi:MAG: ADP-heptose--LPS heptosyltransferase, partial [Luteimonas sp.]
MPSPPASICLLRLSALGDVTHVLPLVGTLRSAWPHVA